MDCYYVKDNGIGIKKDYLKKIFNLFERVDQQSGGTGMGLAITRRIIQQHRGEIWAESKGPGKGTTFYFFVP